LNFHPEVVDLSETSDRINSPVCPTELCSMGILMLEKSQACSIPLIELCSIGILMVGAEPGLLNTPD
jgi:hypothetical protein